ncbi:MAG: hypothetical protein JKY67_04550 [Pseudomonadales bacterium]|nr:hypothetical protein [Pseudomonadales bacterium]
MCSTKEYVVSVVTFIWTLRISLVNSQFFVVVFVGAVWACSNVWQSTASAAELDIDAPMLLHDEIVTPFEAGKDVVVSTLVTDDIGIASVTVYFKLLSEEKYRHLPMTRITNTDSYKALIPAIALSKPGHEHNTLWVDYYIVAIDLAGNAVMRGYAIAPLRLSIANSEVPLFGGGSTSKNKISFKRKWLWIGLGAIVVGAAASAGGSGDVGPESGFTDAGLTEPFEVTADLPGSL